MLRELGNPEVRVKQGLARTGRRAVFLATRAITSGQTQRDMATRPQLVRDIRDPGL
jgi:hypothetical protein